MLKNTIQFFVVLAVLSCCKDEPKNGIKLSVLTTLKSQNGFTYKQSLEKWTEMKTSNGDSYVYQTTFTSVAGFGNTTEIKVQDGLVTSRTYVAFETNLENGTKTTVDSYVEGSDKIGSHAEGALPLTIDELYESCAKHYLVADPDRNTIYFETANEGLMTICGFVPDGCADDCYMGVSINAFDWLN